jgi:hypothetical protein
MAAVEFYPGIWGPPHLHPLALEIELVKRGGTYKNRNTGKMVGNGLYYHFKNGCSIVWPDIVWHRWNELVLKEWLDHKYVAVMGAASSGKTHTMAFAHLFDYYCFPSCTTTILCSTTERDLENRGWGEMKRLHREAIRRHEFLSGHLIEGKLRIVTDDRSEASEGRDFRNGVMAVPTKKGTSYVGISSLVGLKNKRLRIWGDELSLLPKAWIDSLSNLMKGTPGFTDRKASGTGNPADTLDALGLLGEPAANVGGWDGGIDQTPVTKVWETRWPDGVCVQLCGSDSPNMVASKGAEPPYPFLITRDNLEDDAQVWGIDDWHYKMFDEAMMPRGQGSRRVITRQQCIKFHALDDPIWLNSNRTRITFLDAAYRGVGGDRCVFGMLEFGAESVPPEQVGLQVATAFLNQTPDRDKHKVILALIELAIIPIVQGTGDPAEDQIVAFVKAACEERNVPPENFYYDSGMRTSLVQAFSRTWSTKVNSIDCGGKPTEDQVSADIQVRCCDYYSKKVTQLWFDVRNIVEAGQFRGMTQDVMLEFCAREWKRVGSNKIEVESKEELKKKTGRSPDLADALAIGVHGAREKGFVIKRLGAGRREKTDDAWKRALREKQQDIYRSGQLIQTV